MKSPVEIPKRPDRTKNERGNYLDFFLEVFLAAFFFVVFFTVFFIATIA